MTSPIPVDRAEPLKTLNGEFLTALQPFVEIHNAFYSHLANCRAVK
jgi:hypothetical protein